MFRSLGLVACVVVLCGACALWVWAAAPTGSPVLHSAPDTATIPTLISDLLRLRERGSDPSTALFGEWHLYTKAGGLFLQDAAGTVIQLGTGEGGSGGPVSISLQTAYETGSIGGWTAVPPDRPLIFAPEGLSSVQEHRYGLSGDLVTDCFDGSTLEACHPKEVYIAHNKTYRWRWQSGTGPTADLDLLTIHNDGGTGLIFSDRGTYANLPTASYTGQRYLITDCLTDSCVAGGGSIKRWKIWTGSAWVNEGAREWEIPFSAVGLIVDGTNCTYGAKGQINSGPNVLPVTCIDAAGTLELSFNSHRKWDGSALTVELLVVDSDSSSHVWSADVKAMCRTPGSDTINSTWGTAVAATVTMATANIPYRAAANVAPNTGCAGGDWVAIHASILSATSHTDSNAKVIGGTIRGVHN